MKKMNDQSVQNSITGEEMISVVIPVYNVAPYIADCLDSVLAQDYGNLEIIVVDDGSTDNGADICKSYEEKDKRIHVIRQENKGLSAARNTGSNASTGAYISYVDGDDILHPEYFSRLYALLKKNGAEVSVVDIKRFTKTESFYRRTAVHPDSVVMTGRQAAKCIVKDHDTKMIIACGKLYDRKLIGELRFPEGKLHEDEFITYKAFYASRKVAVGNMKLYGVRMREGSITSTYTLKRLHKLQALKECIDWMNDRNDTELADCAWLRYIMTLQISWYNVHTRIKNGTRVEKALLVKHKRTVDEKWDEVKKYASFSERAALRVFRCDPILYELFARICLSLGVGRR